MTEQEQVDTLVNKINTNLSTITDLLKKKNLVMDFEEAKKKWLLEPLYDNPNCSVGRCFIATKDIGPCEEHIHPGAVEYLIVTKGSLLINIAGKNLRIVHVGECCAFPENIAHYSTPLEDETEMIYITVPRDGYIPTHVKREKYGE